MAKPPKNASPSSGSGASAGSKVNVDRSSVIHDVIAKYSQDDTFITVNNTKSKHREKGCLKVDRSRIARKIVDISPDKLKSLLESEKTDRSIDEKLADLEAYAKRTHGEGVASYARQLFPELMQSPSPPDVTRPVLPLPEHAPEIYQGLRGPETPPEFVQRVYGSWLGDGLTRAHIRKLDPKLYTAIDNWLSRPGNEWPIDVDLPTKAEQNTRDIAALSDGNAPEILGKFTGKEAARLGAAIARRTK